MEEALDAYRKALKDPNYAAAHYNMGTPVFGPGRQRSRAGGLPIGDRAEA